MSKMEDNMDKTLALMYQRRRMTNLELHSIGGMEDIDNCLTYLTREDYISRTYTPMSEPIFQITPRGKQFHENGGYAALRAYNKEMLVNSRQTLWFAKRGYIVAVISVIVAIVLFLLSLLLR